MIVSFTLEKWSEAEKAWKDWGILDIDKPPRKLITDAKYCSALKSYFTLAGAPPTYYRVAKSSDIGIFCLEPDGVTRAVSRMEAKEAGLP